MEGYFAMYPFMDETSAPSCCPYEIPCYLCTDRYSGLNTKMGIGNVSPKLSFHREIFRIATETLQIFSLRPYINWKFQFGGAERTWSGELKKKKKRTMEQCTDRKVSSYSVQSEQTKVLCLPRWLLGHYDDLRLFVQQERSEKTTQLHLFLVSYGVEENNRKRRECRSFLQEMGLGGHFGWNTEMEWNGIKIQASKGKVVEGDDDAGQKKWRKRLRRVQLFRNFLCLESGNGIYCTQMVQFRSECAGRCFLFDLNEEDGRTVMDKFDGIEPSDLPIERVSWGEFFILMTHDHSRVINSLEDHFVCSWSVSLDK